MATAKSEPEVKPIDVNMRFYGQVQDTPKEAQKEFNNGRFSGTDINPMWRIKKLTELFGPCGQGWWTQNVEYRLVNSEQTNEVAVFCTLELVWVDPGTKQVSQPVYGVGGNTFVAQRSKGPQASDEAFKMAYTDALSIACKALGFSHDIYFAKDRTKYSAATEAVQADNAAKAESDQKLESAIKAVKDTVAEILKADESKKPDVTAKIKAKIGTANYLKCTDVNKLIELAAELKAA